VSERGNDVVPVDLSETARFVLRTRCSTFRETFDSVTDAAVVADAFQLTDTLQRNDDRSATCQRDELT